MSLSLPRTVAVIEPQVDVAEITARHLQQCGVRATVFPDSDDLLTSDDPYGFEFYLHELALPGIDGMALLRLLRRRTSAGIIVLTAQGGSQPFTDAMLAGADMFLTKPVGAAQIEAAILAVHRRAAAGDAPVAPGPAIWRLSERRRCLVSPGGIEIALSATDLQLLQCFADARDGLVSRDALGERLGRSRDGDDNWLNATIYRLRRRIETATDGMAPLQSQPRVGYVFRARLVRA